MSFFSLENNFYQNNVDIIQKIENNLSKRIDNNPNFSLEEIEKINIKTVSLCPKNFEISDETSELLRVLSNFSQCELKPVKHITSHRKYIGVIIVFLKKLTWPLVRFHLKETFESMQQFNTWTVYGLAKQIVELEMLKQQLNQSLKK